MAYPNESKDKNKLHQNDAPGDILHKPVLKGCKSPFVNINGYADFVRRRFSIILAVASASVLVLFAIFIYLMTTVNPNPNIPKKHQINLYEDYNSSYLEFELDKNTSLETLDPRNSCGASFGHDDINKRAMACGLNTKLYASDLNLVTKLTTISTTTKPKLESDENRHSIKNSTIKNESLIMKQNLINNKVKELLKLTEYTFDTPEKRRSNVTNTPLVTLAQVNKSNLSNDTEKVIKKRCQEILDSKNKNTTSYAKDNINTDKEEPKYTEPANETTVTQILQKLDFLSRVSSKMKKIFDMMLKKYTDLFTDLKKMKSFDKDGTKINLSDTTSTLVTDVFTTDNSDKQKNFSIVNYTISLLNESKSMGGDQTRSNNNLINRTNKAITTTRSEQILVQNTKRHTLVKNNNSYNEFHINSDKINETVQMQPETGNFNKTFSMSKHIKKLVIKRNDTHSSSSPILNSYREVKKSGQSGRSDESRIITKLNYSNGPESPRSKNTRVKFLRQKNHVK